MTYCAKSGGIIKSIIVAMTTVKPLNNGERYLKCCPHTCYLIVGLNILNLVYKFLKVNNL